MDGTIEIPDGVPGDLSSTCRRQVCTYTGPASYVTGGDEISAEDVRMGKLFAFLGGVLTNGTTPLIAGWVPATSTLQLFVASTGVEVANGVDLSGYSGTFEAIGQ